ncbi:armadillo-type protein [Ilyonectria robusta]|uniref:armadillo-type protein n=1 Tax=Ilyonectria robusta TaxID=1079257 RepID=UPI001E8E5F4E|nr:armadillo-type protein [Ilyonectria robusta]KAH8649582.1 armadillo-type protein [Ilyonectria robusta]
MLPKIAGPARIFYRDWPANLLQKSVSTPTTLEESARCLLGGIRQHLAANRRAGRDRPILFIASCLGGIILIKALEIDDSYDRDDRDPAPLRRATRGVVFLATPFRGTAFKNMPVPVLKAWASLHDQTVTALIDYTKEATSSLDELVDKFIELRRRQDYHLFTFYEGKGTTLLRKIHLAWLFSNRMLLAWLVGLASAWLLECFSPWLLVLFFPWLLGLWSYQSNLLVDENSASLQGFGRQRLERTHVLMNKFGDSGCKDYEHVARKIEEIVGKIREGTLLEQADALIRNEHYNTGRLEIERLSGDLLPMDQCYINLAIVEQPGQDTGRSKEGDVTPSPFSLFARQKVETPDKTIQVELPTLFSQRVGRDGRTIQPRRILIRGRAGVGKTTLCKKMVYDFTHGTQTELHRTWTELFDRLLWVPLRNLKGRSTPGYNHEELFYHEYFSGQGHDDGRRLAGELWRILKDTHSSRTLFVLDGLDEVLQDLRGNSDMFRFLKVLLDQPNAIITSRPNANIPVGLRGLDLELETIGFYPDQVKAYLNADPKTKPRANEVQSFLQKHWLIQGLVRIPIQLDALCYTWEDFDPGTVPDTMTRIYQAIERRLWKKDAVRLDKMSEGHAGSARPAEIARSVETEIALLESLAFNGLHSNVIDFTPAHRDEIVKKSPRSHLPIDETFARLSFLRTSGSSSKVKDRNYHFIHLSFQEYFAARYFVLQWTSGEQLPVLKLGSRQEISRVTKINAEEFLRKEKYNARYDIFWRFVAGLLHTNHDEEQLCGFFRTIEEQPRDLLGPVHQRLVMHCLSEVVPSQKIPEFNRLQEQLKRWLLFEWTLCGHSQLAAEIEFPDQILEAGVFEALVALVKDPDLHVRFAAVDALGRQSALSDPTLKALVALVKDPDSDVRSAAAHALGWQSALSDPALEALVALVKDPDSDVRSAAADALGRQSALSDPALEALVGLVKDPDSHVRSAAVRALYGQSALSEPALVVLVALLKDPDSDVRSAAVRALGGQSALSDPALEALVGLVKDPDSRVRLAAAGALCGQLALSDPALEALVALVKDPDSHVRSAAAHALGRQSALSDPALEALVALVKDPDSDVRPAAARALGGQSALSEPALVVLVALLKGPDSDVRFAAADALYGQWALSEPALEALVALVKDPDLDVRSAAAHALGWQSALSDPALEALVALVKDPDSRMRSAAAHALGRQSALSDPALEALVGLVKDPDSRVRSAVVRALCRQLALSEPALVVLVALLKDPDSDVRSAAADALGGQSALSDPALEALMGLVKDPDSRVRSAAAGALCGQLALSEPALEALVVLMKDPDSDVRSAAAHASRRLSALSDGRFYSFLLAMDSQSFNDLYSVWLRRSFSDHLVWYVEGKNCRINMPEAGRDVPFDQLKSAVQEAQVSLKVPKGSFP